MCSLVPAPPFAMYLCCDCSGLPLLAMCCLFSLFISSTFLLFFVVEILSFPSFHHAPRRMPSSFLCVCAPDALRWDYYALDSSGLGDGAKFKPMLGQWYAFNAARFVCSLCGWLAVVRLHYLSALVAAAQVPSAHTTNRHPRMRGVNPNPISPSVNLIRPIFATACIPCMC